ncbi:MAG: hypothetical protein MI976_13940 [Pseudomonadales bacterium]|nr:hypothetical protein [Pseudomonadales bacterium]
MAKLKVVIVDDEVADTVNSARSQNINLLKKDPNINVEPLHPTDVKDWLNKKDTPDLIIIDYRLNSVKKNGELYAYSGASFFSLFRDAFPDVPIYLISAVIDLEHGEFESDLFDRLISDKQLVDGMLVTKDAADYQKIKTKKLEQVEDAYSLIAAPDISRNELEKMLRPLLKMPDNNNLNKHLSSADSKSLVFSRWVSNLIRNRGLLYDDLSASVILGVSFDYFIDTLLLSETGKELIQMASYKGVFSETNHRRWWRDSLSEYVVQKAGGISVHRICEILPQLLKLDDKHIAKCVRCQKNFPDAIGRTVADKTQYPVHLECSEINENQLIVPHFENDRVILELE